MSKLHSQQESAEGVLSARPQEKNVVVVEDDDLHYAVIERILGGGGFHILREVDIAGARERLESVHADLLISDLLLPDGLPNCTIRALLELPTSAPIMVVTSWSGQLAAHALDGGSRLKLFDKNNFNAGDFLAMARHLTSAERHALDFNPFAAGGHEAIAAKA